MSMHAHSARHPPTHVQELLTQATLRHALILWENPHLHARRHCKPLPWPLPNLHRVIGKRAYEEHV